MKHCLNVGLVFILSVSCLPAQQEPPKKQEPARYEMRADHDPNATGKIDMILMVDVYHELSYPYEVTVELIKALKPGGRLIFVEYRLEDKEVPILDVHRMSIKQVMKEMAPHKELKHAKTLDHLPWQHVIIFEKLEAKKAPVNP